jgi:hypothetical protein
VAQAPLLASKSERERAIQRIIAEGSAEDPLFLKWTEAPPSGVDRTQLYIGLMELFGRAKVKTAIPFLIRNIDFYPGVVDIWMKHPAGILTQLPAAKALVSIGSPAVQPLVNAYESLDRTHSTAQLRTIVLALSQMENPEAKQALLKIRAHLRHQLSWIERSVGEDSKK